MKTSKSDIRKKEEERKKQLDEKADYLGNVADKVLDAIEKIFAESTPPPTGNDMIDVLSLISVFVFARQIKMACKNQKTMQSVMKSSVWALKNQIETYAEPFMTMTEPWDELNSEEGGNDGRTESKEL